MLDIDRGGGIAKMHDHGWQPQELLHTGIRPTPYRNTDAVIHVYYC